MTLARYLGEKVETSVRRNSTVRVAYEDWWLSKPEVLERLEPNNYKVTAYYMPDEDGKPTDVYIFQGDRYIDQVEKVETYNRVMAEQTEEDKRKFYHQQKKVREFGSYVADNMVAKVGVMKDDREERRTKEYEQDISTITMPPPQALPPEIPEPEVAWLDEEDDLLQQAINMI